MKANTIREKFLDFFKARKHKLVQSDSLVPGDDPTILFTPAGMNQFKKEFLGHTSGFTRAATAQRCLRTDDLDKVGKTHLHHTFFEMLGNFSFGDYFKEEAIAWAWEFLTEELKIERSNLWVSIYKDDDEAYKIWKDKIKVPENKIIRLGDKENFWPSEAKEKGPNGPCGPCSEIFFDRHDIVSGCGRPDCNPSCNCGRFVEVWNLVFTQFNRKEGGTLVPLPKKNIDTGMGLERLAAVMQGVTNNFETDLFRPIIQEITKNVKQSDNEETTLSQALKKRLIYAISDHIRAIVFAIFDGVLPSNESRGYVIRKLIRKSACDLRTLGAEKPFLFKLVPILSDIMKVPYPELIVRRENIAEIILAEEENFISIIKSSDSLLKEKFKDAQDEQSVGTIAFQLYDTYGIPFELIISWLKKNNVNVEASKEVFEKELEEQKRRSKLKSAMKGDVFDSKIIHLAGKKTNFLGYTKFGAGAKIIKIIQNNVPIKKISKAEKATIILDKTPFYPESGGQVGDTGEFIKGKSIFEVTDTQKFDKVIAHKGVVKEGVFKTIDELKAFVDIERRLSIARNHTATHLLQSALRKVLGLHVQQQGSLVSFDRLRFDFTHFKDIAKEELDRIEEVVNDYIIKNYSLKTQNMPYTEAKKKGALAFFQEKYESKVRMVSVGDFSKELCGGTHLDSTGQIGYFMIIQEGSVASGVRRIEAVTGTFAHKTIKEKRSIVTDFSSAWNIPEDKLISERQRRDALIKELQKKLSLQCWYDAKQKIEEISRNPEKINGKNAILGSWDNLEIDLLRRAVDLAKQESNHFNTIVALGSNIGSKALLVIGVTPDLCQKGIDASKLIIEPAKIIGGSGGGRNDFAQAGGDSPLAFPIAFEKLREIIRQLE